MKGGTQRDLLCERTGLPRRYITWSWSDIETKGRTPAERKAYAEGVARIQKFVTNLEENLRAGRGLYICGPLGVGKTVLLTLVAQGTLEIFQKANRERRAGASGGEAGPNQLDNVRFVLASRLTDLVYPDRTGTDTPDVRLRRELYSASALFLDDLGKIAESKLGGEVVFLDGLMRTRYHNLHSTFYSAQMPPDEWGKAFKAPALADLIAETCEVIQLVAPSVRREAQEPSRG